MKYIILMGCLLMGNVMLAQYDTLTNDLFEIVIHEQRLGIPFKSTSRSIDLITQDDITASSADNLAELLNDVAGVDIRQRGPHGVQSDIGIRGGTFDQTLILINGIKLTDPQTGHHTMNIPIDIDNIERIEVLKGPAARIFGQNGFAGAVNIITKKSNENKINIGISTGEYQLIDTKVAVSNTIGRYGQSLSYSRNASDGYKYNTDYEIQHVSYNGSLGTNGNQLNILASHSARKFGANGFYASPSFIDQYEEIYTSFYALDYQRLIGGWFIQPRVSYRRNKDDYVFLRQDPLFFNNIHISNVLSGEVQARTDNSLGIFQAGVEVNSLDLESNNLGMRSRKSLTVNAEQRILWLDEKLDITPGISYSYFSDLDSKFFPGLDMGYAINNDLKLFANTGYTYRVPTYTDLYYVSSAEVGNTELTPEEAISYEAGLKYFKGHFNASVAGFSRRGKNLIDWSKQDSLSKWKPQNIGDLATSGVELNAQWKFHGQSNFGLTGISANYTFITTDQSEQEALLSRYALEYVKHQLSAQIGYHWRGIHHHTQCRFVDRANLEDYTVVDSKLYYDSDAVKISLNVNNLFNKIYRETNLVVMPGRWISLGLNLKISY